jgi:predicted aspartyl protease
MKECAERIVKVGFKKNSKKVFDEIEAITAQMIRDGWTLKETIMEETLEKIHLFFERQINNIKDDNR